MSKGIKRLIQALVGVLFAAGFLFLALRKVDPQEFWAQLRSIDPRWSPLILLALAAFYWIKAIRWSYLLGPLRPLSAREIFPAVMIGFMGNNVLPAHLGEFVRMYVLAKQYGLSKTAVLSTIVLERVFDFFAIIGILAATLHFIPVSKDLEVIRTGAYAIGVACAGVFALFLLFVYRTELATRFAERLFQVLPVKLRAKLLDMMRLGVAGLRSLRSTRCLAIVIFLTLLHWAANGLMLYFAAVSLPLPGPLPIHAAFLLLSVMALAITLPSAPGYVGTAQYCFVVALGAFAVGREQALAASIYALFMGYVPVTLAGFYYLARLGLKLRTIEKEAGPPEPDGEGPSPHLGPGHQKENHRADQAHPGDGQENPPAVRAL
jgi:uncharacterized protein (TIRG00374 family)